MKNNFDCKYLLCISSCLFFIGCASMREQPREQDIPGISYKIKPGDKLASIAKKYKISIEEICEINNIKNPQALNIGQVLFLPDPDPISTKISRLAKTSPSPKAIEQLQKPQEAAKNFATGTFSFPLPGGQIIQRFSSSKQNPYDGIAIKAPFGAKVLAAQSGQIIFVGDDGTRFGLIIIIEHQTPYISVYTHLDQAQVKVGDHVKEKQVIATVGLSGGLKSPLLHFQIRVNHKPKDPEKFLKKF